MKKIRFADNTEREIYNLVESGNSLQVEVLNDSTDELSEIFKNADKTKLMKYFVGTDLMKAFSQYTNFKSIATEIGKIISIDYEVEDTTTESGFAEITADYTTIVIDRKTDVEKLDERVTKLESEV